MTELKIPIEGVTGAECVYRHVSRFQLPATVGGETTINFCANGKNHTATAIVVSNTVTAVSAGLFEQEIVMQIERVVPKES